MALLVGFLGDYALSKDENKSISVENRTRYFNIHIPDNIDTNKKMPVVMLFHGGGGSVEGAIEAYKMKETSDKHHFILVYPAGTGIFKISY